MKREASFDEPSYLDPDIDWFTRGRHEPTLFRRDAVEYLSAVVMLELFAGAFTVRDTQRLRQIVSTFRRLGRLLVPAAAAYETTATSCASFNIGSAAPLRWSTTF